ncbi:MAG: PilZ domain-containing protein [Pirellulaceae bacterium]|jgi:hypothetical protein|nr:PilZ domain-containing protein [Pirellulaceae bacterium]MDP7016711.1 PilZ domain-containing protein [Pirellulaceae bacterium]
MSESTDFQPDADHDVDLGDDRRISPRVSFDTDLPISRWNGKTLPPDDTFVKVQSKDLSQTGIAFYSHTKPPSRNLVIMLGSSQRPSYTSARVVRCVKEGGRYMVACEFIGRLKKPT